MSTNDLIRQALKLNFRIFTRSGASREQKHAVLMQAAVLVRKCIHRHRSNITFASLFEFFDGEISRLDKEVPDLLGLSLFEETDHIILRQIENVEIIYYLKQLLHHYQIVQAQSNSLQAETNFFSTLPYPRHVLKPDFIKHYKGILGWFIHYMKLNDCFLYSKLKNGTIDDNNPYSQAAYTILYIKRRWTVNQENKKMAVGLFKYCYRAYYRGGEMNLSYLKQQLEIFPGTKEMFWLTLTSFRVAVFEILLREQNGSWIDSENILIVNSYNNYDHVLHYVANHALNDLNSYNATRK